MSTKQSYKLSKSQNVEGINSKWKWKFFVIFSVNFSEIQQFTPPEDFGTAYTSKSYDRKYTKNYSVYNASGCTFLARMNYGTGPLVSMLLWLIFMLAMFYNFAWSKVVNILTGPKLFDMDCCMSCAWF